MTTNNSKFRYDIDKIPSMCFQLSQEAPKVIAFSKKWFKNFSSTRVKREFPFIQWKSVSTKRGNRWHIRLFANNHEDLIGVNNIKSTLIMEYTSQFGKGFIAKQTVNGVNSVFDFTPHCMTRYRQRYLDERNIHADYEAQMRTMVESLHYHSLIVDGYVFMIFTQEGVFFGDFICGMWFQIKTFVAYENAYRNQRVVMDEMKAEIEQLKADCEGISISKLINNPIVTDDSDNDREITKSMIRKSGMYIDHATKKNEKYIKRFEKHEA